MNDPVLVQALHELRADTVPVVVTDDLGRRTAAAARALPRRSWWLRSSLPDDRPGSLSRDTLRITDRAVVSALRIALVGCEGLTPTGITVRATDRRCDGVRLGLAVAYGPDVRPAADAARAVAAAVLADLFGPGERVVDVCVEDLLTSPSEVDDKGA